ncbi:C-terminal binding protein [Thalassoglobus polymorphus]|uniref:Glycerate dehydrogenase n=1 Tax=Thalassoglobus polymorphus TaxID=2527994 RepID=A0A517QTT7_9PLAN|nr:C-terminal binding protein [Thalassoglobus polymorphus]QDT34957.1 Glycerate dehydrogenase [Thalassoglobus polymorphus]
MSSRKILITDHPWPELEIEENLLRAAGIEIVDAPNDAEATLIDLAQDVFAIATCWAEVTEPVIRAAKSCKLICRMGIGLDNINLKVASELEILVTNVPDYCVEEVADHTLGLMLALTRNIGFFHQRTKQGEYNLKAGPPMHRLSEQRLGLIGFGHIGREVFQRAKAFGLDVAAHTPSGNDYGTGCPMLSLDEILFTSDILSLHAPLSDATHHLINDSTVNQLKAGVILINTSRGSLIDPAALLRGLQTGKIAGAGLDVFEPEPPDLHDELYRQENVIATPHAAFVSEESVDELRMRVTKQILAVFNGEPPQNIVNQ